jgi:ATP-dependent helicase IRC3
MSLINLRNYQKEAVESVLQEFEKGVHRQLCVLPVGSGKTVCMAALAKTFNKKTLLLAHRGELLTQASEKFKLFWPEVDVGFNWADEESTENQVIIGSVQSCYQEGRLQKLKEVGFELCLIDEAHHATGATYQRIITELGFMDDPTRLLVGFTATPHRADAQSLDEVFDKVVYEKSIGEMISEGFLCQISGRKIHTNFSLEGLRIRLGDFVLEDLARKINTPERNDFVVEKFTEHAQDRKALIFCCDVQHSLDMEKAFKQAGYPAKAFWGAMPPDERSRGLEALKTGEIQVATSCSLLTEGFDEPSVSAIVLARPTRSKPLFIQCCGRGLRPHVSKQDCLLLDFIDCGHDLDAVASLENTISPPDDEPSEEADPEEMDRSSKVKIAAERDELFYFFGNQQRFVWTPVGPDFCFMDDNRNEIVIRAQENGYIASFYRGKEETKIVDRAIPLDYCVGAAEDFIRKSGLNVRFSSTDSTVFKSTEPPSDGQIKLLKSLLDKEVDHDAMTKGQASLLIRNLMVAKNMKRRIASEEPITKPQRYFLTRRGIDCSGMSKQEARRLIANFVGVRNG